MRVNVVDVLIYILLYHANVGLALNVIYAINAGGDSHTDSFGVKYARDTLDVGTASDYGKRLHISRVFEADQILYQTERYHQKTFGYDIPLEDDGDYVLVLKFCEVYFNAPDMKIFDVVLNGEHAVVADLDIFDKVGKGVAHDEYVEFSISNGKLYLNDEDSDLKDNTLRVEFVRGYKDNPKVNAIVLIKGTLDEVPKLPPIQKHEPDVEDVVEEEEETAEHSNRKPSGPRVPDPYTAEDSSIFLPVFLVIFAFIPILVCLCKL